MAINFRSLTEVPRVDGPAALLQNLKSKNPRESSDAGLELVSKAKEFGIRLRDYLTLAIDTSKSEDFRGLTGYEASLAYLDLPVKDDFKNGISLDLASDTFQRFSGTRAMFPEVIDDMLRWSYRQDLLERVEPIILGSRTISGTEMISTVVNDAQADYQKARVIAEEANIPVWSIRTTQNSVKMGKHGMGYRTSYEFTRRARLDILTPYAARIRREMERSKVALAVETIINGDGVQGAAPVVAQSSYNGATSANSTNGKLSWEHILVWLVKRAQAGAPVDTVVGNWDAYIQWLFLFARPTLNGGGDITAATNMAKAGVGLSPNLPVGSSPVNFALASDVPANQLIGITRAETCEELVEAGSLINESEQSVKNQTVTYVQTETAGFRLPFGDTRSIFNYGG